MTWPTIIPATGLLDNRRLHRILDDPLVTWSEVYAPTLKRVLRWQRAKRLLLLIDESGHSDVFRVLTAAVWYRNRAIPLGWLSWPAQQPLACSYWEYVEELLAKVAPLLPKDPRIVVIADRADGGPLRRPAGCALDRPSLGGFRRGGGSRSGGGRPGSSRRSVVP